MEYILEHAYDEIFVTDNKGIVIYCNKAFEKNYGIKREVILGKDVNLLQELGIIDQTLVHQVIDTKTIVTYKQHTNIGKTILITFKPIFDSNGEVLYIVENCRNISKMTQLEESLKEKDIEIKDYKAHCNSLSHELKKNEPIGKKLDFMGGLRDFHARRGRLALPKIGRASCRERV